MAKIEPANLLLKDKNGNTGLVKSLTNKDITTLKNVVTNVNYIKDFVNANGGSLPVQGDLKLTATDAAGKNGKTLLGTSSGTLQWNGKNIVRSVNGTNADANGNIAITSVENATKAIQDKNGAQIDTTYFKSANGTFTGTNYFRDVNNSLLRFNGGNTRAGGASLMLFGKNAENAQGHFDLVASTKEDGSDAKQLIGTPTGILKWDNKNIVRSVNGVNADASGNVQLGNLVAIPGEIKWFAFNTAPDGYLVCNGANVSRTTYASLFNAIGTTFGSGDGSTTFALPNLIDKFAQGSTTVGTVKSAGLPNITGLVDSPNLRASGCLIHYDATTNADHMILVDNTSKYPLYSQIGFDASHSNSIYGNSSTVQPPALTLLPCIKY